MRHTTWMILGAALCVGGCQMLGGGGGANSAPVLLQEVKIFADKDANDGDATAVDVLVCYDQDVLNQLMNMKANTYFAQADELEQNYPKALERFHFEVVAGTSITEEVEARSNKSVGGFIFANLSAPGAHRYRLRSGTKATIQLLRSSMQVKEDEELNTAAVFAKVKSWLF